MPSAYAHLKLGWEVMNHIPQELWSVVSEYIELYDIGLHGPDIFFYDLPLIPNKVNGTGRSTHYLIGSKVFPEAWQTATSHEPRGAYLAYLYGYLCHFALDSTAHGYVRYLAEHGDIGHYEIEMEFDRMMMVNDGLDPFKFDVTAHLIPSIRNCAVISSFYKGIHIRDVEKSLKSMKYYVDFLRMPDGKKRRSVLTAFKLTGRYRDLKGLLMSLEPNHGCDESNARLLELYEKAIPIAARLITDIGPSMTGMKPMDPQYDLNFESMKD